MEALLAASLAIVGRDRNDPDMALHGAYMQTRALQRLRYSLNKYQEGDTRISPTMLSLTALTCAMSELIANKSWDNFNRHLLGVGALLVHGGIKVSQPCIPKFFVDPEHRMHHTKFVAAWPERFFDQETLTNRPTLC